MMYAIREALTIVAEEGVENCQQRHRENAEYFWSELQRLGLELVVTDPAHRAPALTTVKIPADVDGAKVIVMMRERFQIEIGGALGGLKVS